VALADKSLRVVVIAVPVVEPVVVVESEEEPERPELAPVVAH
jgi:hypothetical protein